MYYLQSRYYDPTTCRFISADSFVFADQDILGNNTFAYCCNNPISRIDETGHWFDIFWDVVSLVVSVVEVVQNPTDVGAWVGLAMDAVDVLVPCVSGLGEATDAVNATRKTANAVASVNAIDRADDAVDIIKAADKVDDTVDTVKTGWRVGDDITNLTKAGNTPSWSTVRQRFWKNEAYYHPELYPDDLGRLKKGLAPLDPDGFSMELHHPLGRDGDNFFYFEPLTREQHRGIHYGG